MRNFASGLLGGVTAAIIWVCIALMVGLEVETIGLVGLILLVVTTIVAAVISQFVGRSVAARTT